MHPTKGPYFNMLAQSNADLANKVINISNKNWDVMEILEETKSALTKVTKNEGFLEQVTLIE